MGVGYGRGRSPLSRGAPVCRTSSPKGWRSTYNTGLLQVEPKHKQQARQEELDGREAAIVAAEEQAQTANKAYADTYFATSELERKKAALESEIDDMAEYRAWKAAKAAREAQEAQEAARREQAEQEARKRQEAAQKAREAQERERQEQAARIAAQDAQSSPESEPPKTGGLMAALLSRAQQAAVRNAGKSGPEYPGF